MLWHIEEFPACNTTPCPAEVKPCLRIHLSAALSLLHIVGIWAFLWEWTRRNYSIANEKSEDHVPRFNITRETLVEALEATFTATPLFAPLFMPLALDKLASSVRQGRMQSKQTAWGSRCNGTATLRLCIPHWHQVW
jgi:Dos2-interacting transcription regulator of RNA-Pol-II